MSDYRSSLTIPPEVADAMRNLRPELRAKLSLRDIDDMTKPFRESINKLEAQKRAAMVMAERAHKISDRYERYLVEMRDSDRITEWTREKIKQVLGDDQA